MQLDDGHGRVARIAVQRRSDVVVQARRRTGRQRVHHEGGRQLAAQQHRQILRLGEPVLLLLVAIHQRHDDHDDDDGDAVGKNVGKGDSRERRKQTAALGRHSLTAPLRGRYSTSEAGAATAFLM